MPLTPTSKHHHYSIATYIPVVDLLLVPSLLILGRGGCASGGSRNLRVLQLALPHLVDGGVRGTRGVLPFLGGCLELGDLA